MNWHIYLQENYLLKECTFDTQINVSGDAYVHAMLHLLLPTVLKSAIHFQKFDFISNGSVSKIHSLAKNDAK